MTQPWFIAVERFGRADGAAWDRYVEWSKLDHVEELVSLDATLCPSALKDIRDLHGPYVVDENGNWIFFEDLEFLRRELRVGNVEKARVLCVIRNPAAQPILSDKLSAFCFLGFDLVEAESGVSALSNCGGWPELDNRELSKCGLLTDHARAVDLQVTLASNHPEEPHADCDVWAIFAELE